jgi:hypothetical protein
MKPQQLPPVDHNYFRNYEYIINSHFADIYELYPKATTKALPAYITPFSSLLSLF